MFGTTHGTFRSAVYKLISSSIVDFREGYSEQRQDSNRDVIKPIYIQDYNTITSYNKDESLQLR